MLYLVEISNTRHNFGCELVLWLFLLWNRIIRRLHLTDALIFTDCFRDIYTISVTRNKISQQNGTVPIKRPSTSQTHWAWSDH
jgi:hypothetical protein